MFVKATLAIVVLGIIAVIAVDNVGAQVAPSYTEKIIAQSTLATGLAVNSDGTLYYCRYDNGTAGILNTQTGHKTVLLNGLQNPHQMTAYDGKLYITEGGSNAAQYKDGALSVLDLTTGQFSRIYSSLQYPTDIYVDNSGIYVLESAGSGTIYGGNQQLDRFDFGSNFLNTVIPNCPDAWAFVKYENSFYVGRWGSISPGDTGSLVEYANGSLTPTTLLTGLPAIEDMEIDDQGIIYIAGMGDRNGSERAIGFVPEDRSSFNTIREGLLAWTLALDSTGDIYFSDNSEESSVRELIPVPEPSTLNLFGAGAVSLFAYILRRRKPAA